MTNNWLYGIPSKPNDSDPTEHFLINLKAVG